MTEENIGQELRLKEIEEKRNYFMEEIKQNELISKKHKKVYKIISYTEHLLVLTSTVSGFVSISAFAILFGIPLGIASSAAKIKISAITTEIRKYKSNKN